MVGMLPSHIQRTIICSLICPCILRSSARILSRLSSAGTRFHLLLPSLHFLQVGCLSLVLYLFLPYTLLLPLDQVVASLGTPLLLFLRTDHRLLLRLMFLSLHLVLCQISLLLLVLQPCLFLEQIGR